MNWLKKIGRFFAKLFSPSTAKAVVKGIQKAAPYVSAALELASIVDKVAPMGKTYGAVMRYAEALGLKYVFEGEVTELKVQTALRDLTVKALQTKFPEASTSDLNRAVEIAVGALKNE